MSALRFFCQRHKKSEQAFTACSDVAAGEGFEFPEQKSNNLYDEIMLFLVQNL